MSHILSMNPNVDSDDSSPVSGGLVGNIMSNEMFMQVGADMIRRWWFKQDPFDMKVIAKNVGVNVVYDMFIADMVDFDFGSDILGADLQDLVMRNLAISALEMGVDMYLKVEKPKKFMEYLQKNFINGMIRWGLTQLLTVLMRTGGGDGAGARKQKRKGRLLRHGK